MGNNDSLAIVFFCLVIASVWLLIKLQSQKKTNRELSARNMQLSKEKALLNDELSTLRKEIVLLKNNNLKFQLQPHTLANVVDTINSIANNLQRGTRSLVDSLNYILYKGDEFLVSVEDEIGFIRKYIQLNELLYSNILDINLDVQGVDNESVMFKVKCIPHLISAYFIENAFKHGDVAQPNFLTIRITLRNEYFELHVINRINSSQPRKEFGGVGLQNMRSRLELLAQNNFTVNAREIEGNYHASLKISFSHA